MADSTEEAQQLSGRELGIIVACLTTALGVSCVMWWMIGDQTQEGLPDPKYVVEAPELSATTEAAIAVGGAVLAVGASAAIAWLAAEWASAKWASQWRSGALAGALVLWMWIVGAGIAFVGRVATMGWMD